MNTLNRRKFIKGSIAAGAVMATSSALGANADIRVAVVGFNGQGGGHLQGFLAMKGVRVVALCDPDRDILDKRVKECADKGVKVAPYTDVRKMLENKDIDAISTASPNHWHALISIWACQASKDVYVEKPCSHTVWEGRQLVKAASKYNRIVQIGTQNRSDRGFNEAYEWIKAGNMGKITCSRGLCYKRRKSIGNVTGPQAPPPRCDYDLWTGPAALVPLMRKNLHYDWHWDYNTGNGDMGNQGIHQMDTARMFLDAPGLPNRVISLGGRLGYKDDGNTANTQITILEYEGKAPIIFEVQGLGSEKGMDATTPYRQGRDSGNAIECEGGYFRCGHGNGGAAFDWDDKRIRQFKGGGAENHKENFINAVRSRKEEDLMAPIEGGHWSSALCHLGQISYLLGKEASAEEIEANFAGNDLANDVLERYQDHLAKNEIDIETDPVKMGPWLNFDSATEQFKGNANKNLELAANGMLRRTYRAPFVVPEKV